MFREGENYYLGTAVATDDARAAEEARNKRPPGLYKCTECGDATITWHNTVDKYKVNCPKCSTEMKHIALIPKPVPVIIKANELEEDAEQYRIHSPQTTQLLSFAKARKGLSKNDSLKLDRAIEASPITNRKGSKAESLWRVAHQIFPEKFPTRDPRYANDEAAEQYAVSPIAVGLAAALAGAVGSGVGSAALGHNRAMKERAGLKKPIGPVGHLARMSALGWPYYVGRGMAMKKEKLPEKWAKRAAEAKANLAAAKKHELDVLAEIYGNDPERARLAAAYVGVPLGQVIVHYAKGTALTGLQLGMAHGKEEAAGTRGSPGALRLWLLQKLHGGSYILGRQKGLGGKHGGTRSETGIIDEIPKLLKEMLHGQAPAQKKLLQST